MASDDTGDSPSILRLPPMIHREIAKYLPDSDLNAVARVDSYFYSILDPILWDFNHPNGNNPPKAIARNAVEIMVHASKTGNLFTLNKLFEVTNVDANARNSEGECALCVAVMGNYCDVVLFLLSKRAHLPHGLNPNERPLTHAVKSFRAAMVGILLLSIPGPADLQAALTFATTPAFTRRRQRAKIIREFTNRFPPIYIYPMPSICRAASIIVKIGSVPLMRAYLIRGGLVNVRDGRYNTLMHTAVRMGNVDMVEFLLANGVIADTRNIEGKTPLDEAIDKQNWDIARLLPGGEETLQFYSEVGFI